VSLPLRCIPRENAAASPSGMAFLNAGGNFQLMSPPPATEPPASRLLSVASTGTLVSGRAAYSPSSSPVLRESHAMASRYLKEEVERGTASEELFADVWLVRRNGSLRDWR
jgi:hypothetical protein